MDSRVCVDFLCTGHLSQTGLSLMESWFHIDLLQRPSRPFDVLHVIFMSGLEHISTVVSGDPFIASDLISVDFCANVK